MKLDVAMDLYRLFHNFFAWNAILVEFPKVFRELYRSVVMNSRYSRIKFKFQEGRTKNVNIHEQLDKYLKDKLILN